MPTDKNGRPLKAGDRVSILAIVRQVNDHADHCNLRVDTIDPVPPGNQHGTLLLNTKQVELIPPAGDAVTTSAGQATAQAASASGGNAAQTSADPTASGQSAGGAATAAESEAAAK